MHTTAYQRGQAERYCLAAERSSDGTKAWCDHRGRRSGVGQVTNPPHTTSNHPETSMRLSQLVGPRSSKVVELPDPTPAAGQVLVEVLACGVCTSDLSAWRNPSAEPMRLGHEIAGRVAAVGADATRWAVGDLV